MRKKPKGVIRRHQRGYPRVQKGKLENIEGVIRRYQNETKTVNRKTDNPMSKSLEMSKEKANRVHTIQWPKEKKQTMI